MIAYKVFRHMKDDTYAPIICGLTERYTIGKWYTARYDHKPASHLKYRPGFHATPCIPRHLALTKNRVLAKVELSGVTEVNHPAYDKFYVAEQMRIIDILGGSHES